MVFDLLENTKNNIKRFNIKTSDDVRIQPNFTADFSLEMHKKIALLRQFLKENFYTVTSVARMDMKSQKIVEELFSVFMNDYRLLPKEIRQKASANMPEKKLADIICTHIASMTDIMAIEEHRKLFDPYRRF